MYNATHGKIYISYKSYDISKHKESGGNKYIYLIITFKKRSSFLLHNMDILVRIFKNVIYVTIGS